MGQVTGGNRSVGKWLPVDGTSMETACLWDLIGLLTVWTGRLETHLLPTWTSVRLTAAAGDHIKGVCNENTTVVLRILMDFQYLFSHLPVMHTEYSTNQYSNSI